MAAAFLDVQLTNLLNKHRWEIVSVTIVYQRTWNALLFPAVLALFVVMAFGSKDSHLWAEQPSESLHFRIKGFALQGNTLFSKDDLSIVLKPFMGEQKTAEDVEKARDALERFYHEKGYPTVLVNIPEQSVEDGVVWLQVVESEIRRVRVTGNRYFTMEKILDALPSLSPGEILHLPEVQRDLVRLNRNRDLKVAPVLIPGKAIGTVDVELKVEDKLPLHGSLELNNRSTHDTTHMRLNAMLSYDNLWQKDHSVSVQYQTSPKDTDEVKALAFSYVLPAPWNKDHVVAVYSINSDSETAFGEGFNTVGEGFIVGCRYVMPLPPKDTYAHNLTVGVDYKDFDEELGFGGDRHNTRRLRIFL
jgi:hemolysin activation/secretion protein